MTPDAPQAQCRAREIVAATLDGAHVRPLQGDGEVTKQGADGHLLQDVDAGGHRTSELAQQLVAFLAPHPEHLWGMQYTQPQFSQSVSC